MAFDQPNKGELDELSNLGNRKCSIKFRNIYTITFGPFGYFGFGSFGALDHRIKDQTLPTKL
jgi:hypothetical protein